MVHVAAGAAGEVGSARGSFMDLPVSTAGTPVSMTGPFNPTDRYWAATIVCQPGGGPCNAGMRFEARMEIFCSGQPGDLQPSCCPPDPTLTARIDQVLQLVTLIQRQIAPFAYVPAGTAAGLTGAGELELAQLLGVSVLLTTLPGHYGLAEGDPDRLFDVGWLALGTADGFEAPRRITTSPFFLRASGDHTRLGYSLSPGVVAEVRFHQREP